MASPLPAEPVALVRWCPSCSAIYRADFARCPVDGAELSLTETDPLIGTTLAQHYVIDSFLGEGAMARVYRAHHARLANKQFAVKIMIGDLAATLEMRLRFAQEADAASQLAHPNVVTVVDFGRSERGMMFMVMELVEGRSLAEVIAQDGPIAPRRALQLARQLCLGLAHAHERGLVHRDLKPENIVLSGRDLVRIVDFGLAVPTDDERSTRLTSAGLAMGTPTYAAPEQTHGMQVDHRADLFALGVTLFEMLAGKPPFEGGLVDIIRQNASDIVPPIIGRDGKRVTPAIEDVVRKLMRRDPDARYADAAATLTALEAAALAPSRVVALLPDRPSQSQLPIAPVRRGRMVAMALIGVALVGGLATAGILATSGSEAPRAAEAPEAVPVAPVPTVETRAVEPVAKPPVEKLAEKPAVKPVEKAKPVEKKPLARPPSKPVATKPVPVQPVAEPTQGPIRTIEGADRARGVADTEFYGGPKGFAKLPDPVDPGTVKPEPVAEAAPAPTPEPVAEPAPEPASE